MATATFSPSPASLTRTGLGDLRLSPKVTLWKRGVDVAVFGTLRIPTSGADYYRGDEGVGATFGLAVSRRFGIWRAGANAAYRVRNASQLLNQKIDDELEGRIGAAVSAGSPNLGLSLPVRPQPKISVRHLHQKRSSSSPRPASRSSRRSRVRRGWRRIAQGFGTPTGLLRRLADRSVPAAEALVVVEPAPAPIAAPSPPPELRPCSPNPTDPRAAAGPSPARRPPPPQRIELVGDVFFPTTRRRSGRVVPVARQAAAVIVAHPEINSSRSRVTPTKSATTWPPRPSQRRADRSRVPGEAGGRP